MADAPRTRPFRAHRRAVSSASIPTYHKTAALSVGSVMSGGAGPSQSLDSVTGVDMVKHLDWIEREERRGRIVFDRRQSSDVGDERARSDVAADTSDNESDGNEAEPWGVRSEGDVLQRPAYSPLLGILSSDSPAPATPSGDSSYGSLRAINADKSPTRKRSGSLTDVTDAPIAPRDSRASLDYDRRPSMLGSGRQARGYSRRSVDGGDRRLGNGSASWLGDDTLDEIDEDDAEADEAEDEASHREVVVIEVSIPSLSWPDLTLMNELRAAPRITEGRADSYHPVVVLLRLCRRFGVVGISSLSVLSLTTRKTSNRSFS